MRAAWAHGFIWSSPNIPDLTPDELKNILAPFPDFAKNSVSALRAVVVRFRRDE